MGFKRILKAILGDFTSPYRRFEEVLKGFPGGFEVILKGFLGDEQILMGIYGDLEGTFIYFTCFIYMEGIF